MSNEAISAWPHNAAPLVDVVIVNWDSGPLLRQCVAALDRSTIAQKLRVVVVDNASTDASLDGLSAIRVGLHVIRNVRNEGFAAACNQGAKAGHAPYLLFLNPDANVNPDAIDKSISYLSRPDLVGTGILGIKLTDRDGRVRRCCARKPSIASLLLQSMFFDQLLPWLAKPHFMTDWSHEETGEVDQVPGAFLIIRRRIFEALAGFDERFFVYYEDVDICARARARGWSVVHFADASAEHLGGGTTESIKGRRMVYFASSKVAYSHKHHGLLAAAALMALITCVEFPTRVMHAVLHREFRSAREFLSGFPQFLRYLLILAGRRERIQ
jgi:N-acetylglucosaminyl-diphospho-decaprenol L-rhamnosyltransferase